MAVSPRRPLRVLASPAASGQAGNPYIDQLTAALRGQGALVRTFTRRDLLSRPDVVHVHWPVGLVRFGDPARAAADVAKVLGALALARRRGAVLVWTGHDTEPHEGLPTPLHRLFFNGFLGMVDGVISLGDAAADVLRDRWPVLRGKPFAVVPHGHYRDAYPAAGPREAARAGLGIDPGTRVHLALGQVRPYKNLPDLVAAARTALGEGEQLCVVGAPATEKLAQRLHRSASGSPRVRLELRRVSEDEVALWHAAADTCVLFYGPETALNSGAALLGLSFDRPVVVRDSPAMAELAGLVGDDWVRRVSGSAVDALAAATGAAATERAPRAPLGALDWDVLGASTLAAYDTFRAARRRR